MQKVKPGKREKSEKQKKNNKIPRIVIAAAAGLLLLGVSFTVYAKYYKTGYNKGIAIASGFYFSSNYMTELDLEDENAKQIGSIEELKNQPDLLIRIPVRASNSGWNNNGSSFDTSFLVDVDNYDNQLLYNDVDLNLSYTVEFILLDAPEGVTYQVCKGSDTSGYVTFDENQKASFQGKLEGGKLSFDTYQFQVSISNLDDYKTAGILALAYPTDPAYVQGTKKIAGIITADYREVEMEITRQGFTIESSLTDTNWREAVKAESAYVYQVKTTGNYSADMLGGQKQKIKVTWNPKLYKLHRYDQYRLELEEKYSGAELQNYFNEDQGFMIVETLPYSSIQFTFFKKDGFDTELGKISDLEGFKNSVHAEKLTD